MKVVFDQSQHMLKEAMNSHDMWIPHKTHAKEGIIQTKPVGIAIITC